MKKLKKHLTKNNYEYVVRKDEVIINQDNLIVKIWKVDKEYTVIVFNNAKAVMFDDYVKIHFKKNVKKTIKQLNKLVTS